MLSSHDSLLGRVIGVARRGAGLIMARRARLPYPELARLVRYFHSGQTPPQILLLGDSVMERVSRLDKDKRPLDDFVTAAFKGTYVLACISRSAYHMNVYDALLGTIRVMRHKPKLVIMPVNMRSFSPQWDLEPSWQFDREIEVLGNYVSDPQRLVPVLSEMAATPAQFEEFDATEVQYPHTPFNKVGHFRLIINARPQSREQFDYRKRQIFIFHYLHRLTTSHRKVKSLRRIAETLQAMNIALLAYITPVNYQAGNRFVGSVFSRLLEQNVKVVRRTLKPFLRAGTTSLDLSTYLAADNFFNNDDPTEHLNQYGRLALASAIANAGIELLASKGKSVS